MYGQTNNYYGSEYTSGQNTYSTYVPQDQFVERSTEVVHEVSRPENHKSREVYKAGRVFRDEDDLLPAHQTRQAEEALKSSYNYYTPTVEPQYVERSREVVHEVPAEKQKSTREVYKGGRVFRDEDDILPTHQTKPAEETVKSSYNHYVPEDTNGFVERSREVVHEVSRPENQKASRELYKGGRVFRDEDDILTHQTKPAEETVKSSYNYHVPEDTNGFVERNREIVHEVSRPENQKASRELYKGGRVFRDEDDIITHQTKPAEETVKSSYNYYVPEDTNGFVERNREIVHEVSRPENQKASRELYKGGRVFREEDDIITHQIKPAEETVKSSYNYHVPEDTHGGFVERSREIVHEAPAEKQKASREVYKGGRVFRDEDDLVPTHQVQTEEAVKSSYNHHAASDEPQFVERTREFNYEKPENYENTLESRKGGRNY